MALVKAFPTEYGVDATYVRVSSLQLNYELRHANISLEMFISEETRRAGKKPPATGNVTLTFDAVGSEEPSRTQVYEALKQRPDFDGATDA